MQKKSFSKKFRAANFEQQTVAEKQIRHSRHSSLAPKERCEALFRVVPVLAASVRQALTNLLSTRESFSRCKRTNPFDDQRMKKNSVQKTSRRQFGERPSSRRPYSSTVALKSLTQINGTERERGH